MSTGTAAEHAERAALRFEKARDMTEKTFQVAIVVLAMVLGWSLASGYFDGEFGWPLLVLAAAGGLALSALCTRLIRAGLAGRVPVGELVASGVLALALAGMIFVESIWFVVGPIWVSVAAMVLPGLRQVLALSTGAAAVMATFATLDAGAKAHWYMWPTMFALFVIVCLVAASANLLQKWMWDLFQEAYAAREAQAVLAVSEERLRFARDLHDLLGHNLSLIAVKSELAIRMAEADPGRARAEMADVRQAARDALREVRAAVRGYRVMELDAELASVRAVLQAAGVRCTVEQAAPELPDEIREALAWVVREGATNILKHSDAKHCTISLRRLEEGVVLEMSNDGARTRGGASGVGLTGLTERVAKVGGGLTAEHTGQGRFLLRATIPLAVRSAV